MKTLVFFILLLPFVAFTNTRNCQIGQDYCQTVDGNIQHNQSTGCKPFLEPFDCTVEIDLPRLPEPGKPCLTGQIIDINLSTESQIDVDLFQAKAVNPNLGIDCSGAVIS